MSLDITRHDASFSVATFNENNNNQITLDLGEGNQITLFGLPDRDFNALIEHFSVYETHRYSPPRMSDEDKAEARADEYRKERQEERAFS